MGKSPLILAALAQAAIPAAKFTQVQKLSREGTGPFDSILLTTESGQHLVARVAHAPKNETDLVTEVRALDALTDAYRARLPFTVSRRLAETNSGGQSLYVFDFVYGSEISINNVGADSPLTASLGNALAAIHNLPLDLVQSAGLREFSPEEIRRHRVAALDRALETGKIPPILAQRWDAVLEDVSLFRFQPSVVHGAFNGSSVLTLEHEVSGVLNWSHLQIGDPADDLSWICAGGDDNLVSAVRATYATQRNSDDALWLRAQLYSELDLVTWLLHNVSIGNADYIAEAQEMLEALAAEVEQGLVPSLGAQPQAFAAMPAEEIAFVSTRTAPVAVAAAPPLVSESFSSAETGIVELVAQSIRDAQPADDLVTTYSAPITEPVVVPHLDTVPVITAELDDERTEPLNIVDDKTRPIELPPKGDNELF